jgi:putative SOS response-associated peptidase YedK
MCGRFTLTTPAETLAEAFGLDEMPDLGPRWNIAPTQAVAAVRRIPAGAPRSMSLLRWGLVPAWSREPRGRTLLINARAETLIDKPAFRDAFERRRCLIPADGFYEWRNAGSEKEAYLVRRADGRPFAFAGLWEPPVDRDPGVEGTCTIVTTDPNEALKDIHDRMPVILSPEDWNRWLDPEMRRVSALRPVLRPCPAEALTLTRVGPAVNNAGNETPDCAQPLPA